VNNDGGTKCRAQVRDSRISENAGKVEQGRPTKRRRKPKGARGRSKQFVCSRDAGGINSSPTYWEIITLSLSGGIDRARVARRDSSKREDRVSFRGGRLNSESIQREQYWPRGPEVASL